MGLSGKGALGGAASGAAMGSALGPYGAVAGGVIGGIAGLFGGPDDSNKFQAVDPYSNANNPNSALGQALLQQQQVRAQQQNLATQLTQQAAGGGPSPSQTLLAQALSQNAANTNAMAAANRGHYSGMAMRDAMTAQNTANQQAAATGVAARQQEMLSAQGQLGNLYGTMGNQGLSQQGLIANSSLDTQKMNSGVAAQNSQQSNQFNNEVVGGVMNGAGAALTQNLASGQKPGSSQQIGGTNAGSLTPSSVMAAHGGVIPGKASVAGDSKVNDTVSAKLSPGEIVIPRSHAQNAQMAKEFIDELMSKQKKGKSQGGFGKVLEAHRKLGEALKSAGVK